jgi:quercetin dioxygenase-like cupin family protein
LDGEAEVEIAGNAYKVKEGETITLPANIPHAVKAATRFKMLLTMIRAEIRSAKGRNRKETKEACLRDLPKTLLPLHSVIRYH